MHIRGDEAHPHAEGTGHRQDISFIMQPHAALAEGLWRLDVLLGSNGSCQPGLRRQTLSGRHPGRLTGGRARRLPHGCRSKQNL